MKNFTSRKFLLYWLLFRINFCTALSILSHLDLILGPPLYIHFVSGDIAPKNIFCLHFVLGLLGKKMLFILHLAFDIVLRGHFFVLVRLCCSPLFELEESAAVLFVFTVFCHSAAIQFFNLYQVNFNQWFSGNVRFDTFIYLFIFYVCLFYKMICKGIANFDFL